MGTNLEEMFLEIWSTAQPDLPVPVPQYRFHPKRRWRMDWAWPRYRVAVEIDGAGGGGYGRTIKCQVCGALVRARTKGGGTGKPLYVPYPSHAKGADMQRNAEKQNAAVLLGWSVFRFTSSMLREHPKQCADMVAKAIYLNDKE